jgi:hypothetical protein
MGENALIPLRLFKLRAASVTIAGSVIVGAAMFGAITVLPQYMQIVHGASPTKAGLMMLPMVVGMMGAGIGTGLFTSRTGKIRAFPIIGSGMAALAMILLSLVSADTSLWWVMGGMLLLGLGLGQCMQPLTIIVQNAVPPRDIGVATSSATFFRQLGGTLGVAVFLSMLFSTLGGNIKNAFVAAARQPDFQRAIADPANSALRDSLQSGGGVLAKVQNDSSVINGFPAVLAHPFKVGFADSMSLVLLGGGCVMVLACLVLMLLPKVELRATSAGAAARAEERAEVRAAEAATD